MSLLLKQNRNRTKSIADVVSTVRGSLRAPEAVGAGVMDTGNRACPVGVILACGCWRVGPTGPGRPRSRLLLRVRDLHLELLIPSLGLLRRNGYGY